MNWRTQNSGHGQRSSSSDRRLVSRQATAAARENICISMHIHHGIYHRFFLLCFQLILNGQHLFGKCSQHMLWVCKLSFFFARFCSGSRHSVGCLLVKLPGGQHHEAFARAEILIAFSSRRSHEDLIKSYCTFFLFQVLHVTSSYPFRVFLGMELSDTTPWFTYETSGKGPLPIGCRSGCKAKGVSKSFPSISELLVDENGISGQAEVAARRLRLHGSFQANLVFFFDSTSRLFVSFWNQREQGKWKLASSCREGNHLQKWYVM